jgi:hypothetical protein
MANTLQKIFRIEPGVTLGQWVYDRIANNWERLVAIFVAGGGMTYLANITAWIKALGPFGVGGAGLLSALIVWVALSYAKMLRADARLRHVQAEATKKWETQVDSINPLAAEFHTKRIKLLDLKDPVVSKIIGKRFIDCELIGPANIAFFDSNLQTVHFLDCDALIVKEGSQIHNAIALESCILVNVKIINCALYVGKGDLPTFTGLGASFITFTGDPEVDKAAQPKSEV